MPGKLAHITHNGRLQPVSIINRALFALNALLGYGILDSVKRTYINTTRVKTHKLLQVCKQVVTSLLTSCQQVVFALLVPSLL